MLFYCTKRVSFTKDVVFKITLNFIYTIIEKKEIFLLNVKSVLLYKSKPINIRCITSCINLRNLSLYKCNLSKYIYI